MPYPGAAYAAQVLDGSTVAAQTLLPGVAYSAVMTTGVEVQTQYAQPVTSSCRQTDHLSANKNMTASNTVPVLSAVNQTPSNIQAIAQTPNNGQSVQLKQPLQSINLTDLLDYSFLMEHGMAEAAGTMDLRNPAVLANMLQTLNAASLPSASCSYERSTHAAQPVDIRQFPAAKQPVLNQQPFQEAVTVNQQHVPLSSHQLSAAQLYASHGTVVSSAAVVQSSQQKGAVPGAGVIWPWSDQLLITDKAQNEGLIGVVQPTLVTTSASSCSLPVSYEAVSPPAASVDNMSFSLLDNLQFTGDAGGSYQLSSFLGSSVDTSSLNAAGPYSIASAPQRSTTDTWSAAAVTSASFPASTDGRLQPSVELNERSTLNVPLATLDAVINRQSGVELEKVQKQKSNLGIVMPMTHNSHDERGSTSSCSTAMSVSSNVQPTAEQQSQYLTNSQPSVDKSSGPVADTAAGGIVLTNITGNVYVNQYTMMPGGSQPVDNALLHADLSAGAAAGSLSYDNVADETMYSLAAPSVAFMLNTTSELSNFAAAPVPSVATVQQSRNPPQPATRKTVAPESSFFGAEAAPVLAAKPSNKFESCFLQFICGHKAETLSSVLNSPIKTRPVLPKYIPEPRRPKAPEVPVDDIDDKKETTDEPIPIIDNDVNDANDVNDETAPSAAETASATNVCYLALFLFVQGIGMYQKSGSSWPDIWLFPTSVAALSSRKAVNCWISEPDVLHIYY